MSDLEVRRPLRTRRRRALIALCAALWLCLALAQQAKADFIGYYALSNFTLTNSVANGSVMTPDGGQSIVLTGGNNGGGNFGTTNLTIFAASSGLIQFNWSYSSIDPSSSGQPNMGCGLGFAGSCDDAGYLLNGTYFQLADDIHQGSGVQNFLVTAGESFGFRVETLDNTGGPGILTVSAFTAPAVPEPSTTTLLFGLTAAIVAAQRRMARTKKEKDCRP
jgi:hypothetical protein